MSLRVLRRLVAIDVMSRLQYRGTFFIYMVSIVARCIVPLLVWLVVSEQSMGLPLDRSQLVTYYVLLGVVSMLTSSWLAEWLARHIRLGRLSPWLLRPTPYIVNFIANNLAEKVVKLPCLLPMVFAVGLAFRHDLRLPADPHAWALFLLCLPLAAAVTFLLDFLLGSLAFWIEDVNALSRVRTLVGAFLSGQIVPLALFPAGLDGFLQAQPFRYTLSFPLEVLTGSLTSGELALGFALQIGYCILFWAAYRLLWRHGLRAYSATGA